MRDLRVPDEAEDEALFPVREVRAEVRPPLSLDRGVRGGEEPLRVRGAAGDALAAGSLGDGGGNCWGIQCIRSLQLFEYKFKDGSFSQEYGVFAVFALFMGLYLCFAGGVLIFQLYLVATNTTTREVLDRKKCAYLRGLTYNPFTRGLLGNIAQTACPNPDGE